MRNPRLIAFQRRIQSYKKRAVMGLLLMTTISIKVQTILSWRPFTPMISGAHECQRVIDLAREPRLRVTNLPSRSEDIPIERMIASIEERNVKYRDGACL